MTDAPTDEDRAREAWDHYRRTALTTQGRSGDFIAGFLASRASAEAEVERWFDPSKKLPEDGQECLLMPRDHGGLVTIRVFGPMEARDTMADPTPAPEARPLAERIETAETGSRKLDAEIARHFGWHPQEGRSETDRHWYWEGPNGEFEALPRYTTSLDAALALVNKKLGVASPGTLERNKMQRWSVDQISGGRSFASIWPYPNRFNGEGSTPTLALIAALLKALSEDRSQP